jgi:hypothetical protein
MKCQHCSQDKPDVRARQYTGPGGAYRGVQPLPVASAYFSTCDDCDEDASKYASDMLSWLHEQFATLS